jgi:hypothetical protein
MGRVVGGAARGTVDHGGRGHRVACVVLAGRDAGRRSGHRGQGELLLTRMRGSISRGDFGCNVLDRKFVEAAVNKKLIL